jgi:hypothetical protein
MKRAASGTLLATFFMVVSCLAYSSTLKLEIEMKDTCTMSRVLLAAFILVCCMAYFSTLKMQATNSSETYIDL